MHSIYLCPISWCVGGGDTADARIGRLLDMEEGEGISLWRMAAIQRRVLEQNSVASQTGLEVSPYILEFEDPLPKMEEEDQQDVPMTPSSRSDRYCRINFTVYNPCKKTLNLSVHPNTVRTTTTTVPLMFFLITHIYISISI